MPLKRLENLLKPNDTEELGDIVRRARDMGELAAALQRSLPQDYAASIQSANIRENGELVVLAASPAWAARLRFEADQLMAAARDTGAEVSACKVRVERGR
jgi:hypothetical protein